MRIQIHHHQRTITNMFTDQIWYGLRQQMLGRDTGPIKVMSDGFRADGCIDMDAYTGKRDGGCIDLTAPIIGVRLL